MSYAPRGSASMAAAAAPRRAGRGGLALAACAARSILPAVCVLAPAGLAAATGQLPSQARPQPEPLAVAADLEDASRLRLGLLQTDAVLSGAVDAEGCEGTVDIEEGPYVQAGLLQKSAQLTEPANDSRRAGALEDVGAAAASDAPLVTVGLRLLASAGTLRRSGSAALLLAALFVSLLVCAVAVIFLLLSPQKESPEGRQRPGMAANRRGAAATGDLGAGSRSYFARADASQTPAGLGARTPQRASPVTGAISPELSTPVLGSAPSARPTIGIAEPPARGEALLPPVLCPTLVLPNMDTCFRISMNALQDPRSGTFDIKGASGRALLGVSVRSPNGRMQLQIGPVGREDEPRAVVKADPANAGQLLVYGRDGALFATLESISGHNSRALVHEGEVKMMVMTELGLDLQFQAFAVDRRLLADAGRSGQDWALRVRPKVDAILVTACMLAMVYFGPGSTGRASAAREGGPQQALGQRSPRGLAAPPGGGPAHSRSPSAPGRQTTGGYPGYGGR